MDGSDLRFLDRYLPYLLRQADQALSAPFYAILTEQGVARSEWRVLAVLRERGSLPVADLATAALSPQPTVSHAVRRLEHRGLVHRAHGEHDKRQRLITITPAGSKLALSLMTEAKQLETETLSRWGDAGEMITKLRALASGVGRPDHADRKDNSP